MRFLDTNILLYSVSSAQNERTKRETAERLLLEPDNALSVQDVGVEKSHHLRRV